MLFAIFLVSALVLEWILRREEQRDPNRDADRTNEAQSSSGSETRMSTDLVALAGSLNCEGRRSESRTALEELSLTKYKR